jgi:ubiquinone biosynthesis protein COQ9
MSEHPDLTGPELIGGDWAEQAEQRLLSAALNHVETLGWTSRVLAAAARESGLSVPEAELLLPEGPRDLAALLARRHDAVALATLADRDPAAMKIRDRIRAGVLARVDAAMTDAPATRRWMGFLALPLNAALGLRLLWASADGIWRWAGDTATDENHYSKRALVAEILLSTLGIRLTAGAAAAEKHLDGRIAGVMAFERWKAGVKLAPVATDAAALLGRLRYRKGPVSDKPPTIAPTD